MEALLEYISAAFVLVPLILSVFKKSYLLKDVLPIFILLVVTLVVEILNTICFLNGMNNMLIFNIYTPAEFILFMLFYKNFFNTFQPSFIHIILIILFLGVAILDTFFINDYFTVNNFSPSIESIVFIIYSLSAFFFVMKKLMYKNLLNSYFFWINTAILIYFAGNLFLFLFSNHLQKGDLNKYEALYCIHSTTNIIYYILISIGFWKAARI